MSKGESSAAMPGELTRIAGRWIHLACIAVTAIPLIALIVAILRFHVEAPYREQWYFMDFVVKSLRGALTFSDLWSQEAEHRHLFPYLLMIPLARISHWNLLWELMADVLLMCVTIAALFTVTIRALGQRAWPLLPMISIFAFSLAQFECWLWSYEMVTFVSNAAVVGCVVVLAAGKADKVRYLAAAVVLAFVASYSFASGFMVWPVGAVIILLMSAPMQCRLRLVVLWVFFALLCVGIFLPGYQRTPWSAPGRVLSAPANFVKFVLVYLGNPIVAMRSNAAAIAGACGVLGYVLISYRLIRTRQHSTALVSLAWGLGLFALLSAASTGVGRAHFGDANSPRYITTSWLFWAGLILLLYQVILTASNPRFRQLAGAALAALVLLGGINSVRGWRGFEWWHGRLLPAQTALQQPVIQDEKSVLILFPKNPAVHDMVETLRSNRLGLFRPRQNN